MEETITTSQSALFAGEDWSDPLEAGVRGRVREFIEAILEEEPARPGRQPRNLWQRPPATPELLVSPPSVFDTGDNATSCLPLSI